MARFEKVECLFCGPQAEKEPLFSAQDLLNGKPGTFYIVRCTDCGLVFQDPRPVAEDIGEYYTSDASFYQSRPESRKKPSAFDWIKEATLSNHLNYPGSKSVALKALTYPLYRLKVADQTIPRFKENGKLLEIGCGSGARLLRHQERGWNVTGIELQDDVAKALSQATGLRVLSGNIETMELSEQFDAIVMDMVLEHLYNPVAVLKQIRKWLRPGGELVLTIPYFEGAEFKIFGKYAYGLQLPYHLYFFNREHLRKLLSDFSEIRFVFQHFDRDVVASAGYQQKETRSSVSRLVAENTFVRKLIVRPLVLLGSFLNLTSRITVRAS